MVIRQAQLLAIIIKAERQSFNLKSIVEIQYGTSWLLEAIATVLNSMQIGTVTAVPIWLFLLR